MKARMDIFCLFWKLCGFKEMSSLAVSFMEVSHVQMYEPHVLRLSTDYALQKEKINPIITEPTSCFIFDQANVGVQHKTGSGQFLPISILDLFKFTRPRSSYDEL